MATKKTAPPPWERENPKKATGAKTTHLSATQKAAAKAAAKKAGRPYPNLVDNMRVAKKAGKTAAKTAPAKKAAAKKAATKKAAKKVAKKAATEDPDGGLTAAGRKAFAERDGSHLKPGVTKGDAEMTPEDMRRKGSWASRFYGRDPLPPLVDAKGEPTRFALSAHAWGEPVPKTESQARRIAAKGRQLLERYRKLTAKKAATKTARKAAPTSR